MGNKVGKNAKYSHWKKINKFTNVYTTLLKNDT